VFDCGTDNTEFSDTLVVKWRISDSYAQEQTMYVSAFLSS